MEPTRESSSFDPTSPPAASRDAVPPPGAARPTDTPPPFSATEPPSSLPATKADLGKRFVAVIIDSVIGGVLAAVIPYVGWLLGGAYFLIRDGLDIDYMKGRSLGKHIMKLRPVRLDGRPMDLETSLKRNWMFGIGYLAAIPIIGWILSPIIGLVGLGIGIYEIYKVITDAEGRRWGDTLAGTKVIEVSE